MVEHIIEGDPQTAKIILKGTRAELILQIDALCTLVALHGEGQEFFDSFDEDVICIIELKEPVMPIVIKENKKPRHVVRDPPQCYSW